MQLPASVDVLVVGCGPVGATLAALLGRQGVDTLVVDRAAELNRAPRAIALDNDALRILQQAGLEEGAFHTVAIPFVQLRSPLFGDYARANTTGPMDGHPKLVTFFQPELEEVLAAQLAGLPTVRVQREVEVAALEQGAGGVTATLQAGGRTQTVRASYVVGADGAGSFVRGVVGLGFEGETYPEDWLVIDARGAPPIDHVEFLCDPDRSAPHMPAPGNRTRWEFKLRPGETREQVERPEFVRALLRPWTGEAPVELERVAVYRFHARCAARFSVGRVFLVGDAAHLTPPFAGQGLVSGLRDASNLAWKLAAVVQGRAGPSVLESYDVERRPLARASIEMARLLGRLIMPRNLWMAALVHGLVRFLGILPFTRRLIGELEIKPVNRFASGLFAAAPRRRLGAGGLFPQALVREGDRLRLSDGLLGDAPTLVGLGFDPAEQLSDATLRRWRAIGGSCVQLCHRGQALHLGSVSRRAEDVSGAFLGASSSLGWAAVVRPDRVVMCEGTDCERLVTQALALLAAPEALAVADRSVRAEVAA